MPLSYKLHAELAAEHSGAERWGYRKIHCGQLTAKGRPPSTPTSANGKSANNDSASSESLQKRDQAALGKLRAAGLPKDLDWVSADAARSYSEMGDPNTTAQVHPYEFTTSMAALAEEKGVKIILGATATRINKTANNTAVESITYTPPNSTSSQTLPATDIILAAGPWTQRIYPPAPISAMRAHSVTIRPSKPISAYALFTEITLPATDTSQKSRSARSKQVTPEIYARPNNEAYCCGEGDHVIPLPSTSAEVQTDDARCQDIIDAVSSISDEMRGGEVLVRQACYLPNVQAAGSGGPLIGETGVKGLLLAAGHTCWGIQNGPGTGKLMSEFVFEGKAVSAKVGSLDPRRVL